MPALNRVQLIGRLGRDPESRYTPTGKKVAHFSLAVSQRWKVAGDSKDYTEWVNIEAWDRLGEVCQEYLNKGSLIYVEGRLKTDRYEDQDGGTRYFTKVVAQVVQFLSDRQAEDALLGLSQPDTTEEEEDLEPSELPGL